MVFCWPFIYLFTFFSRWFQSLLSSSGYIFLSIVIFTLLFDCGKVQQFVNCHENSLSFEVSSQNVPVVVVIHFRQPNVGFRLRFPPYKMISLYSNGFVFKRLETFITISRSVYFTRDGFGEFGSSGKRKNQSGLQKFFGFPQTLNKQRLFSLLLL